MNKYVLYVAFLLLGIGIGYLLNNCEGKPDPVIDPQIKETKDQIKKREPSEIKLEDTVKALKSKLKILQATNSEREARAKKAEARLKEARKAIPLTHRDTIVFLQIDTAACDSALLRSKELAAGLTIEIITDNAIIKGQGELIDSLHADKKDLLKVDSLHLQKEKKLFKSGRKKFLRGLGIGGVLGIIIAALLL